MRYIFIELETTLEDTIAPGVYTYDNQDTAMARFHRSLGNHLANPNNYRAILCHVIRQDGFVIASQRYEFPKEEPEEASEEANS